MIDPFVLLTPVLVLAVMALLRFIGCDKLFDVHEVTSTPQQTIVVSFVNRTPPGNADDPLVGVYQDPASMGALNFLTSGGGWFWQQPGGGGIYVGPTGDSGSAHTGTFSFANTPPNGRILLGSGSLPTPRQTEPLQSRMALTRH